MTLLQAYDYPGNIRELRNLLERASLLCDGDELRPEYLAEEGRERRRRMPPETWQEIQQQALRDAMAAHHGTRRALAKRVGISERTLYRRLAGANGGDSHPR